MLKYFLFLVAILTLASCDNPRKVKGEKLGDWEVIVSGNCNYTALYRYVDKEYGVVVYVGDNYRITSQKLNQFKEGGSVTNNQ